MIFTLILDLEASRKAKEASKARRRKIRHLKKQQRMRQLLVKQALTFVLAFLLRKSPSHLSHEAIFFTAAICPSLSDLREEYSGAISD